MKRNATRRQFGFALFALSYLLTAGCSQDAVRHPSKFFIPAGYVGFIEVKYGVKGAPTLPLSGGFYTLTIPSAGVLKTSTPAEDGYAIDEYYYVKGTQQTRLNSIPGNSCLIWDISIGMNSEEKGVDILRFFVGSFTDSQYADLASEDAHRVDINVLKIRKKGRDLSYKDFTRHNLSGLNLMGANFSSTSLNGANLRKANLSYAILQADMRNADFRGANLQYADLHGEWLQNADLRGADLRNADLTDAILKGAKYDQFTKWPKDMTPKEIQSRTAR